MTSVDLPLQAILLASTSSLRPAVPQPLDFDIADRFGNPFRRPRLTRTQKNLLYEHLRQIGSSSEGPGCSFGQKSC
jgi:hypothetical protein